MAPISEIAEVGRPQFDANAAFPTAVVSLDKVVDALQKPLSPTEIQRREAKLDAELRNTLGARILEVGARVATATDAELAELHKKDQYKEVFAKYPRLSDIPNSAAGIADEKIRGEYLLRMADVAEAKAELRRDWSREVANVQSWREYVMSGGRLEDREAQLREVTEQMRGASETVRASLKPRSDDLTIALGVPEEMRAVFKMVEAMEAPVTRGKMKKVEFTTAGQTIADIVSTMKKLGEGFDPTKETAFDSMREILQAERLGLAEEDEINIEAWIKGLQTLNQGERDALNLVVLGDVGALPAEKQQYWMDVRGLVSRMAAAGGIDIGQPVYEASGAVRQGGWRGAERAKGGRKASVAELLKEGKKEGKEEEKVGVFTPPAEEVVGASREMLRGGESMTPSQYAEFHVTLAQYAKRAQLGSVDDIPAADRERIRADILGH